MGWHCIKLLRDLIRGKFTYFLMCFSFKKISNWASGNSVTLPEASQKGFWVYPSNKAKKL